jgi:hypothetical protein
MRWRRRKVGMHGTKIGGRRSALIREIASMITVNNRMPKFPINLTLD